MVRGTDPGIRIRTKMLRIPNTRVLHLQHVFLELVVFLARKLHDQRHDALHVFTKPARAHIVSVIKRKIRIPAYTTEYTEKQPLLSGVHSVMRVKLALAGEGGGARPPPLITFTITSIK